MKLEIKFERNDPWMSAWGQATGKRAFIAISGISGLNMLVLVIGR